MQLQPVLATEGIAISFDFSNQWLYVDWQGEHNQETSQAACLLMLEALRAWPCNRILNDNSSITRTTMELSLWGAWWLEEMVRAGLQHIAWVFPRNFAARQSTESVLLTIERPIVGTFDDVASAYVWLQQQHNLEL
ncbi:hypothetical protein [Hymenobacter sp.]|jgi:hypothetical protein|uniref:hypothetical protein n=1 Tax=Hymenobacter sp. TaxID=1898978 RepID=UPI002ED9FBEE